MSKVHNKNISKVDSHFQLKMLDLQLKIEKLQIQCDEKKRVIAKINEQRETETDIYIKSNLMEAAQTAVYNFTQLKIKKNELTEQYKEVKKMYKMIHRAIEERWQDGFNEGVQFMTDIAVENAYKKG